MTTSRFNCDRCGLCCRNIGGIPQLSQFDRGDGVCCHLTGENLCDIYENRPEVCSVERMYSRFAAQMTREQYLEMMSETCSFLKKHEADIRSGAVPQRAFEALADSIPRESLSVLAAEVGVVT